MDEINLSAEREQFELQHLIPDGVDWSELNKKYVWEYGADSIQDSIVYNAIWIGWLSRSQSNHIN